MIYCVINLIIGLLYFELNYYIDISTDVDIADSQNNNIISRCSYIAALDEHF